MLISIKQHLSDIWSSIQEKVKHHWGWVEKKCYLWKKRVLVKFCVFFYHNVNMTKLLVILFMIKNYSDPLSNRAVFWLLDHSVLCQHNFWRESFLKIFVSIYENSHVPIEFSGSATALCILLFIWLPFSPCENIVSGQKKVEESFVSGLLRSCN